MEQRLKNYLWSRRVRWGFTQAELAYLLGLKSGSVVSRIEGQNRQPALAVALACQVLFDSAPGELFPGVYSEVEDAVVRRAHELHESLQGKPSKATKTKLDFLEKVLAQAAARNTPECV